MKIGILTQPLNGNYGGIVQNYALQQVLKQMGHNPITIDRHIPRNENIIKWLGKFILRLSHPTYDASLLSLSQKKRLNKNQLRFISEYITTTGVILSQKDFDKAVANKDFQAFIVGSDQCWRPCYSANINNYFLNFAIDSRDVKRIAYAASFGVDKWEFSDSQTSLILPSAKSFTAISVREDSGIELCKNYLGVDSEWVLDPTMLLGKEGFKQFVGKQNPTNPYICTYILEESSISHEIVNRIKNLYGINEIKNNNRSGKFTRFTPLRNYENISVEEWVTNIANAKALVTDSFHGIAFALLFNVPFIVRLNNTRGNTRIESLLRDFELEECISNAPEMVEIPDIDWDKVNRHLRERKDESLNFLIRALK